MIVFQKIRYKNFLSTGDNFTTIDFVKSKTTLVVGSNGSGKSTMLDALSFALFGRSHRNINKPQLVNSINNKSMLVEVEFLVNKSPYKIVRGLKPVVFEIWQGDRLLNQNSHSKEYQKILEQNILKLNHKSFHQVVVLGSSSFVPFMQLPSHTRREVIEDLLDIGVFSKMNNILRERMSALKDRFYEKKHAIDIVKAKIDGAKANLRDLKAISEETKKNKQNQIEEIRAEISDIESDLTEQNALIDQIRSESDLDVTKPSTRIGKLNEYKVKFTHEVATVNKSIKFFTDNKSCPSCDQEITEETREMKIEVTNKRIAELEEALDTVNTEYEKTKEILDAAIARNKKIDDILKDNYIKQQNLNNLGNQISKLSAEMNNQSVNNGIVDSEDSLQRFVSEYDQLVEQKAELAEKSEYNNVILEMLKDSGFKAKIIKQYLPVMNKLVNHYLQVLDFFVHFELDEEFRETIRSRHRDAFTYDSFSEGEKQRIDLSLLFTWRHIAKMKNSVSTNLLMLDETFDSSLDADGVDNLMKILDTLDDSTNVFVISHKGDILDGKFASKIEFKKDNNFSRMVV